MTVLDYFFEKHTFSNIIDILIQQVGLSILNIIGGGLLALASYLILLPSKGAFASSEKEVATGYFINRLFYVLSGLPILLLLFKDFTSFLIMSFLQLTLFLTTMWNAKTIVSMLNFDFIMKYQELKKRPLNLDMVEAFRERKFPAGTRKLLPLAALWTVVLLQLFYFAYIDLSLPLIAWIVIFFSLIMGVLQIALSEGVLLNLRNIRYVKVTTEDGHEISGFLTGHGADHYIIMKKDQELFVQSSYIRTMVPFPIENEGKSNDNYLMQQWYLNNLDAAKKELRNYSVLNTLFDGLKGYEQKEYSKIGNIILHWCLPNFKGLKETISSERLKDVENALEIFDVLSWSPKALNALTSRLRNDDFHISKSVYVELHVSRFLIELLGKDKVRLDPPLTSGGKSDILIKLNGNQIYFEVGALAQRTPEKKIEHICREVANYLKDKLQENGFITVFIDTAELVFDDQGRIDEERSVIKLTEEINNYALHMLVGTKKGFSLEDAHYAASHADYIEALRAIHPDARMEMRLVELYDDPKIKEWMSYCNLAKRGTSKLLKYVMIIPAPDKLTEVQREGIYLSKAATKQLESFTRQICDHIMSQANQLEPSKPNIIIVNANDWTVFGMDESLFIFRPIYEGVVKLFDMEKFNDLSGVAIFSSDIRKNWYIINKHSYSNSRLTAREITNLGLRQVNSQGDFDS